MKTSGLSVGYHIGFAEEFYTLWYVNPANGGLQQADYCGRISKDIEVVKTKYPNLPFSNLKGQTYKPTYSQKEREEYNNRKRKSDIFIFGKYEGNFILSCEDVGYVKWYYEQTSNECAAANLKENGYIIENNSVYTEEEYQQKLLRLN